MHADVMSKIVEGTSSIVAALVESKSVAADQVSAAIRTVGSALTEVAVMKAGDKK